MGEHAPVVLLHGFAGSTQRTWAQAGWLDLLTDAGRRPVGVDLLGHGTAPRPHDPAAYDDLEIEAVRRFPGDRCDVIAFSAGGRVALELAAEYPDRIGRVVIGGLGDNVFREARSSEHASAEGRPHGGEVLAAAIEAGDQDAHPFMRWLAREAVEADLDEKALAAFLRRPNPPRLDHARLAAVEAPVLLVMGDQDWTGPAEPLADALPNASVVTLRGVDHFATPRNMGFMDAAFDHLGLEF